jgi:HK97 family phage portal protein
LYQIDSSGEKVKKVDGRFYELLMKPNEGQTTQQFLNDCIGFLTLTGNAIILKEGQGIGFGYPVSLKVLPTQLTTIDESTRKYVYTDPVTQLQYEYDPEEIIHIKYFSPSEDNICSGMGMSPLQAGFMTVDASNDLREADQFVLKNKGVTGILTNKSNNLNLGEGQKRDLQRIANAKFGKPSQFGQIMVANGDYGFINIGMTGENLKLLESSKLKMRDLCNLYGFDSSLMNDPDNKTYNNRTEAKKDFYTDALMPVLDMILTPINQDIAKQFESVDRAVMIAEFDYSGIEALQSDQKLEAEKDNIRSSGITNLMISALTDNQKRHILIHDYGFSEVEADEFISQ